MASEISKIGGIRLKGGVSLGDCLSEADKASLGLSKRSLKQAQKVVRETSRLQDELRMIEEEMRK